MPLELGLFGVLGLAMGSFLTLVVERLDTTESFLLGRSHCNNCKETLRWWEMLPFAGYFIVRGKCVRCNAVIPKIYPLFELITAAAFIMIRLTQPEPVNYILLTLELLFASTILMLFFYDWLFQSFPTVLLLLSLIVGLMLNGAIWGLGYTAVDATTFLHQMLLGAVVGAGFLALLALPSRGHWMGYGDVIVGAIIGLWVGYPLVIVALAVAFYAGALVGLIQLATKRLANNHHIAFGPFLILGGFVARIWGEQLITWVRLC